MTEGPRRKGLGRGLAALIDDARPSPAERAQSGNMAPVDRIRPNPDQPRKNFDQTELDALATSIREKGVIQPLIVRQDPARADGYQIVAGERRWRAAQLAQVHEVPVIVRNLTDAEVVEIAILENVQRADLNPIEEASGYAQLVEKFGHTQEQLASAIGKSRSHIANTLRLLALPADVVALTRSGALSAGHARALITAGDPSALARIVVDKGLSVRETEKLARAAVDQPSPRRAARAAKDADTRALEADLAAALGLKVVIDHKSGGSGEIRIAYGDLEQLDGVCRLLSR
jgi:ParB family chromosome partitioning protein